LTFTKKRLEATVENVGLKPAYDPSNHDVRFMRAKIRALRPHLEGIALTTTSLASLARRATRAHAALERITQEKFKTLISKEENSKFVFKKGVFDEPEEIFLRLLERICQHMVHPAQRTVRLEHLEALSTALYAAQREGHVLRRNVGKVFFQLKRCGQLTAEAENPRRFLKPPTR
jgi:tRNA(Ile)-lysidine synthase